MSKVAVVIPIYKEELDDLEKISLAQVRKVLKNYPIIFVAPEGKNFSYLEPGELLVQFHPQHFQSVETYSELLLQPFFYEPFMVFEYILIYQLDAFVFYDALEEFCRLGYDYIGAAWPIYAWFGNKVEGKTPRVGNGGFSLRKVRACHRLLSKAIHWSNFENICKNYCEDGFFAMCGVTEELDFNVAPIEVANLFAMNFYPDRHVKKLGGLPFGCHYWTKYSADFYVKLFAKFGYNLRPLRDQMHNDDYEFQCPLVLIKIAMERLIRELEHGKSIIQYLPAKRFASVRVIKSFGGVKILGRLLLEENFLADKIFFYDKKSSKDLIRDLNRETLPHLIIALKYDDTPFMEEIEDKGFTYGKHFILFQHEYMKFQEKLFHSLGR